jgi:O-antigen/teichoic acid export membrane protein
MKYNKNSIFSGTFFTVGVRWVDRLVGLLSTFILARILTPEDFGVVAVATLTVGLTNVFFNLGVQVPLIKIKDVTKDHYDTAWTIKIIQSVIVTSILVIGAPLVTEYFNAENSVGPLYALAFMPFLMGLQNIGIVDYQKSMHFEAEFRFLVIRRIFGFLVTIILAWALRSYWALVIGSLATALIGTLLSYIMHPMRPSLSLKEWKAIFSISQWMLLKNIGVYLQGNLQHFFVGRWFSPSVLGSYTLAANISVMPSSELLAPFNRVLFPAFSKRQDDWPELKRLFMLAQGLQTLIAMPASAGLALVAHEAVPVLLGGKWHAAIPFVQVLSWIGFFEAITTSSGYVMLVLGYVRLNVMVSFIQVGAFAILAIFFTSGSDAVDIAFLRLLVAVIGAIFTFALLRIVFPVVSLADFVKNAFRPIFGVISMIVCIYTIGEYLIFSLPVMLICKIFCGFFAYVGTVLFFWILCKKPYGAESYLLSKIDSIVRR